MPRCDRCDTLQPPHVWRLYNRDCKPAREWWWEEEYGDYFEENKTKCDERCWELVCYNLVDYENYVYYCSKHRLESGESYCLTSDCYYKTSSYSEYCYSCKIELYPDHYTNPCSYADCSNRVSRYDGIAYCSDHRNACLVSNCSNRTSLGKEFCPFHQQGNEQLKPLVKQRTSLSNPQEVIRFNTWWNNNLATVINGNNSYTLWVLVYEPAIRNRAEIIQKFEISNGYDKYNLESAKNKASSLRSELNDENPILAIVGYYESISVSALLSEPYVIKREVPHRIEIEKIDWCACYPTCSSVDMYSPSPCPGVKKAEKFVYPSNPDDYLKPLDIIKVKNKKGTTYFHFAVYLGNGKVSHVTQDNRGAKIENWNDFLDGAVGELTRYHLTVPYKKWDDTLRHISKAAASCYKKWGYNLCNDNCEHYAWEQVTGIDYSEQAIERPNGASFVDFFRGRGNHGVKYWTSVNLQRMLRSSSQKFDNSKSSDDYQLRNKINEIKGSESEWQAKIEVPYKPCQIM